MSALPQRAVTFAADQGPETSRGPGETLTQANYKRLAEFVHAYSGIKMPPGKKTMLEGRIRKRVRACGRRDVNDYCRFLFEEGGVETELVDLIDVVTTNKTDFFREPKHFDFLTATAVPALIASAANRRPLLVWSAGCSTGEEPYTLAIVLSEYALACPGFSFRILATDISTTVLKKAELGVYSTEVVRSVPAALKVKYFMRGSEPESERVRVVPELRRLVEFRRLNFMDANYGISGKVDAVFCRNVIIYFDRPTQQRILGNLAHHLVPGGFLFVGHAETLHDLNLPLAQVAPALYRRVDDGA